jgi:penicillin-binding protein-related factor A (putative recombinase)
MASTGKNFEIQWAKSAPDYALVHRLSDSAQSFGRSNNVRFSLKNPFDFFVWDSKHHKPYAFELKTVAGKSISFEREKEDKGEIHYHQIQGLNTWNKYDGMTCGFIIEFREMELTIFIDIESFNKLMESVGKKSFNIKDLDDYDIPYRVIPQRKIKVNYRYDMDSLLSELEK